MEEYSRNHSKVAILSMAVEVPGEPLPTQTMLAALEDRISPELRKTLEKMEINSRHFIVDRFVDYMMGRCGQTLLKPPVQQALDVMKKCLEQANCDPSELGLLIAATNSAERSLPCLAYQMVSEAGDDFPKDINVINMENQGCSALPKTVEAASFYLASNPSKKAIIVLSETHSLYGYLMSEKYYYGLRELAQHGPREMESTQKIISNFLFGDGAVALLIGYADQRPQMGPYAHCTNLEKDDKNLITLDVKKSFLSEPHEDYRSSTHLHKNIPERGAFYALQSTSSLFKKAGLKQEALDDFEAYFIHTGSKKILHGICQFLGVDPVSRKVRSSYKILTQYGNLSSCSIGFILHDHMKKNPHGQGLLVSFGAGFSATATIVDYSHGLPILN